MGQNHPTSVVSPKNMDPCQLYSSKYPEKIYHLVILNLARLVIICAPCLQCAPPNWNQKP